MRNHTALSWRLTAARKPGKCRPGRKRRHFPLDRRVARAIIEKMQIATEGAEGHWLSTGEAARLCSVILDAVQKWIRKGRISAQRTAGGHYRIALGDIAGLMTTPGRSQWFAAPPPHCAPRPLRCWECLGNAGEVPEDCKRCVVYRVRASWCFEVLGDARAAEDARAFCHTQGSCSGCSYFKMVYRLPKNILVVTTDPGLTRELAEGTGGGIEVRIARNGYEASTLVGVFQPGCVIFDQDTAGVAEPAVLDCLLRDGRVPAELFSWA